MEKGPWNRNLISKDWNFNTHICQMHIYSWWWKYQPNICTYLIWGFKTQLMFYLIINASVSMKFKLTAPIDLCLANRYYQAIMLHPIVRYPLRSNWRVAVSFLRSLEVDNRLPPGIEPARLQLNPASDVDYWSHPGSVPIIILCHLQNHFSSAHL